MKSDGMAAAINKERERKRKIVSPGFKRAPADAELHKNTQNIQKACVGNTSAVGSCRRYTRDGEKSLIEKHQGKV